MSDIPDNVDLTRIARTLVGQRDGLAGLRADVRDMKADLRSIREDVGVLIMRFIRMDEQMHALPDDLRNVFEAQADLRRRVEDIESR